MSFAKIGRQALLTFIGLLPWSVLIAVFFWEQLGFSVFRFWKEIFLLVLFVIFFFSSVRGKIKFSWDGIDILVLLYTIWLLAISFYRGGSIVSYIYWLRYDVEFLWAFLFLRRAVPLWNVSFKAMAGVFLISGGAMLIMSILIRYIFGETILTIFGFNGVIWSSDAGGAPPIYHDINGSSIIRFQWVLEGPNQMAFFLVLYIATYATLLIKFFRYRVINTVIMIALLFLFLETYSRSAYIGISVGVLVAIVFSILTLFKSERYMHALVSLLKKILIPGIILILVFLGVLFQFRWQFYDIFTRHGSTSGHYERMMIGFTRFLARPLGSGLAEAGPASRWVADVNDKSIDLNTIEDPSLKALAMKLKVKNPDFYFTTSNYYIPESWYVQQLVEGGLIWCLLLLAILFTLLFRLKKQVYFLGGFVAVMIMNIFLHSFESVHTVLALFLLLACFLPVERWQGNISRFLKYLFSLFLFLLPWHALMVTVLQCKLQIDPIFLRFWKEFFIGAFFLVTAVIVLLKNKNIFSALRMNPIALWLWLFLISSCVYLFFPSLHLTSQALLGFRYDVFFLLAFLIGMYLPWLREYQAFFLKTLFLSTALLLGIFLIWYIFFDIATTTRIFGFSSAVSTFHPETCLAFSQNVAGHHRLQATFGGPIRFSVFIVMTYLLFIGSLLGNNWKNWIKTIMLLCVSGVVFLAVFYSYSKTSYIGLFGWMILYAILYIRLIGKWCRRYVIIAGILVLCLMSFLLYQKRDLFVHLGSVMVRQENLSKAATMFLEKPFGYGLGSAGPASQIQGGGIWFSESPTDFLPENWYLQILIEQGIIGLALFLMTLFVVGRALWQKMMTEKDTYSIALFSAFAAILFMGCFTHVFEEAATSYVLFFLIGLHLYKKWK